MTHTQLHALRRKAAYYRSDAQEWMHHVWPRIQSFNWFVKANRDRLVAEGAIIKIGRDYYVDAERFPDVAEAILVVEQ